MPPIAAPPHSLDQYFPAVDSFPAQEPLAALNHGLKTIACEEDRIQAWSYRADASACAAQAAQAPAGRLRGIPFGVKDVIDVRGMPTRCGSNASCEQPAAYDATAVALLRAAGAIPVGKTVTAEYAFRHPGPTRNPWHSEHTPGGSSSGSAAAVAAGMVPLALSTQTGGSIIRPAAYCGVPGFKPSFGLLSRQGLVLTCDSLDVIGWHGASMTYIHAAAQALLPTLSPTTTSLAGTRIAIIEHGPGEDADPETLDTLHEAIALLASAGAAPADQDARASLDELANAHTVIMPFEFARNLAPIADAHPDKLTPALLDNVAAGRHIAPGQYLHMRAVQHRLRHAWHALAGDADFIITPAAGTAAPSGRHHTGTPAFSKCWTVLGWPSLHLPVRLSSNGLPLGVQLVARWEDDARLLAWATQLETLLIHYRRNT